MKKHFLTVVYAIDDKPETVEAILAQRPWQAVAHTDALKDLDHAQADLTATMDGYDAARLEVASLKAAKADARHDIDDLTERDESQRLRIAELEAQLEAIGAGGVEPLRKRECLHQIIEPALSEWDVRGHLAASLTCWPRLTGQEAAELVALFDRRPYPPHWNEAVLCVVMQPKKAVKLGCDCPSLDRLDGFIDAASAAQGGV